MYHHELWRDETQAWMLTKASNSLAQLMSHLQYEGHPAMWNFILWPFTYFDDPEWIKVPHYLLAISTCAIIMWAAPFPRWVNLLLVFGYFFFFEYGVISRDYQIGIIGIIGFLATLPRAPERPWASIFFIAIVMISNVFAMLVMLPLALHLLLVIKPYAFSNASSKLYKWLIATSIIAILLLIAATAYLMIPPEDSGFATGWYWHLEMDRLNYVARSFGHALIPIPSDRLSFWNYSFMDPDIASIVGLILFIVISLLLSRYPKYLVLFLLISIGIASFQHIKFIGSLRHGGHYWIGLVAVLWLLAQQRSWSRINKGLRYLFTAILLIHLYAMVVATVKDINYKFSGGKSTAAFVLDNGYYNYDIIGHNDFSTSTFAAYHGKPIYYPMIRDMGTFIVWSDKRVHWHISDLFDEQECEIRANADHTLIVSNEWLGQYNWLQLIYNSDRTIVADEQLFVYRILP